jgi:protease I
MKVAFLATDMVEQAELTEPWKAVEEQGWTPELVSLKSGNIQGFNHYDKADTFDVDATVEEASADDYDALVLPGGVGNRTRSGWTRTPSRSFVASSSEESRWRRSAMHPGC